MPRISFEHPEITEWWEREEQGTSTFDLCNDCFNDGDTADTLNLTNEGYNGDPIPEDAVAESTGSEVPDIDDCGYKCQCCEVELTEDNYYE